MNVVALTLSLAAMAFGLFWLVWILVETLRLGIGGLAPGALHRDDAAAAGRRRRPRQRDLRQRCVMVALATLLGTPIGILAGIYLAEYGQRGWLGQRDALRQRHPAVGAVDRDRPVRLRGRRRARSSSFSGWAGVARAGADRDPGRRAHHREHAARWCPNALREAAFALGAPKWKVIMTVTLTRGARRRRHRRPARGRAHLRRDRAAALHRAQQPVLDHRHERSRWPTCR